MMVALLEYLPLLLQPEVLLDVVEELQTDVMMEMV
jgi:hypothetical protein